MTPGAYDFGGAECISLKLKTINSEYAPARRLLGKLFVPTTSRAQGVQRGHLHPGNPVKANLVAQCGLKCRGPSARTGTWNKELRSWWVGLLHSLLIPSNCGPTSPSQGCPDPSLTWWFGHGQSFLQGLQIHVHKLPSAKETGMLLL